MSEPEIREPFDAATDAMIFYAFRYCLGRQTYAVNNCVEYLMGNWHRLSGNTREQIKVILSDAMIQNHLREQDRAEWAKVLAVSEGRAE